MFFFFLERRRCLIANCKRNEIRFVPRRDVDRCRRNKIEPPTLNCPVVLKFRSRKKFQVIGITIGEFGCISLVTFGSRSDVRGGQDEQMRTIGNRTSARSNNTRRSPFVSFYILRAGCSLYLSAPHRDSMENFCKYATRYAFCKKNM